MGEADPVALVLDAGALIALEGRGGIARVVIEEARAGGAAIVIPAAVLAQVFRGDARQVDLARLVRSDGTVVESLDVGVAEAAGILCALSGTSDVVDASVVIAAHRNDAIVLTSDEADLRRIDPDLRLVAC